ncbi:hydrolase [Streptomyces phaeoluteigriseus]|uniref:Hydrolase n=1 Tax=Streptomyces phaeoluteigriseus TaxID=114686 RepID=A0ABY4Z062_9ACTN|nr:hydrolase [Streptomyces phaeoluteigriseus]USQ82433.1 hydrolase [Streptomyces phaeoluteigriseus]
MSLWTSLEPASATVDPGASTRVRLRVRNTGDVVDEYRFEPVGSVAPWTTVEPPTLRLFPGTTGTVELTFAPPRTPDAIAGPNPYAVRITPTEHPDAVTVPEGNLTVTPFTEVRAELVPPTVKGRFRGRPRLAIDNLGNTRVTASLSGTDTGDRLSYDLQPGNVQIEPGRAVFVDATLRPRQIIWFGSKEEQPYSLAVRRSGAPSLDVDGTFVQRGFLPRWLATALSLSLALAIAFVMIWLAYKPQVRSLAAEKLEQAGVSTLPPPSPSAPGNVDTSPPPPPAEKSESEPAASAGSRAGAGGGGGGGGASEEAKPKERTAATAVQELAARSDGRHICYRAYVADRGWQDPVCDGAEAGTVGKDLPIKALDIAVSGTKGAAGNGAHVVEEWLTGDKWSSAADGIDMYIGSTKEAVSPLQGFTIKVGDGSVCQNTHVANKGWMGLGCTKPGGWMYGGSPMEEAQNLEAIRLTV